MWIALLLELSAFAVTAQDLAAAMEVPTSDIVSVGVTGNARASDVVPNIGIIVPRQGSTIAWIGTGRLGNAPEPGQDLGAFGPNGDATSLTLTLDVPASAASMAFDFNFLSAEYPEFVGSQYNDAFKANVDGDAWSGNAAKDSAGQLININSALFDVTTAPALQGTGYAHVGGATGWLTAIVPVDPGTRVTLELEIFDRSDGQYDSSVALDAFRWTTLALDEPVLAEPVFIHFLSPKRGHITGGETTTVHGEGFREGCVVSIAGQPVPTTFVDSTELEATVGAHLAGLVDVDVDCDGLVANLSGGFTYFDIDDGLLPPRIDALDPQVIGLSGGVPVDLLGEDFGPAAVVLIDGEEVATTRVDDTLLQFTAPPHDAGAVDVDVMQEGDLSDHLAAGLVYVPDDAAPAPADASTPPLPKLGCGCNSTGGLLGWLPLLFLVAVRRSS